MNIFDVINIFSTDEVSKKVFECSVATDYARERLLEFTNALEQVKNKFYDFIENFPLEGFYEVLCSYALVYIYYPPCTLLSFEQSRTIVVLLTNGYAHEDILKVESIIQEVYTNEAIKHLTQKWNGVVREDRMPILQQGIQTYFSGLYYASNATLLTQLGGIIEDNDNSFKKSDIVEITQRLNNLIDEQKNLV